MFVPSPFPCRARLWLRLVISECPWFYFWSCQVSSWLCVLSLYPLSSKFVLSRFHWPFRVFSGSLPFFFSFSLSSFDSSARRLDPGLWVFFLVPFRSSSSSYLVLDFHLWPYISYIFPVMGCLALYCYVSHLYRASSPHLSLPPLWLGMRPPSVPLFYVFGVLVLCGRVFLITPLCIRPPPVARCLGRLLRPVDPLRCPLLSFRFSVFDLCLSFA